MTQVVFYKSNGKYYGFDIQGHTGLAESGEDVLCAAISAMTMLVINSVQTGYHAETVYTVDEDNAHITFFSDESVFGSDEKVSFAAAGLIGAYFKQLKELECEYSKFLSVKEIEKSPA